MPAVVVRVRLVDLEDRPAGARRSTTSGFVADARYSRIDGVAGPVRVVDVELAVGRERGVERQPQQPLLAALRHRARDVQERRGQQRAALRGSGPARSWTTMNRRPVPSRAPMPARARRAVGDLRELDRRGGRRGGATAVRAGCRSCGPAAGRAAARDERGAGRAVRTERPGGSWCVGPSRFTPGGRRARRARGRRRTSCRTVGGVSNSSAAFAAPYPRDDRDDEPAPGAPRA